MNNIQFTKLYANQWAQIDGLYDMIEFDSEKKRFKLTYVCKVTDISDTYLYTGIYTHNSDSKQLILTFTDIDQNGDIFPITPRKLILEYSVFDEYIDFSVSPRSLFWRKWTSTRYYFKEYSEDQIDEYFSIEPIIELIHAKSAIAQGS
jgi:hypothetical protein